MLISFFVFIIFLILKLKKIINWDWKFITMPLWLPFALAFKIWSEISIIMLILGLIS